MRFDRQQKIRHMVIAGGATDFPTGVVLGDQKAGAATTYAAAQTITTTAGQSVFAKDGIKGAWIHSILFIDAAGPTGTLTFQTNAGNALGIVIPANAASRVEFPGGLYIAGGFKVISTTTGDCIVTYEIDGEPR